MDKPKSITQGIVENSSAPIRGVGDVIARVTKAIGVSPCASCEERRKALNKILPIGKQSDQKVD